MVGPKSKAVLARDEKVGAPCAGRVYDFVFSRGKGCYMWDADGKRYLDFAAGIAVLSAGHCNPEISRAVEAQLKKGSHVGFYDLAAEPPVAFMEKLVSLLPHDLEKVFLCNSGTESVEAGFKLARYHTRRPITVAFEGCFHGRTMGSLSLTHSKPVQWQGFEPLLPAHHLPYPYVYRSGHDDPEACSQGCLQIAQNYLSHHRGQVSALFIEPVQGEGGYVVPPKGFLPELFKICHENDVLFAADEVQAGCFRSGTFLASEQFKVKPDIVCMAKGVGGGYPIGAMIASKKLMDWPPGSHANTYGGNLISTAAGLANLNFLEKIKAGERATKMGKILMERLEDMQERHKIIGDVRGIGLMMGMELVRSRKSKKPAKNQRNELILRCRDAGLVLLPAGQSVVRFCPPLIITKAQLLEGLDIIDKQLSKI